VEISEHCLTKVRAREVIALGRWWVAILPSAADCLSYGVSANSDVLILGLSSQIEFLRRQLGVIFCLLIDVTSYSTSWRGN